jgi:hypothetical protein
MSTPPGRRDGVVLLDREGRRLGVITLTGLVTALSIVVPIGLVAVLVLALAPGGPWWPAVVVTVLALLTAAAPDSGFGFVTLVATSAWWLLALDEDALGWSLPAAACLLAFHLATAHAAAGPEGRSVDPAVVRRLAASAAAVLAGVAGLWLGALAVVGRADVPAVLSAAALLAVGALPWLADRR